MAYRALYRVFRPQTFGDLVGQEHITQTLQNALKEQRFSMLIYSLVQEVQGQPVGC